MLAHISGVPVEESALGFGPIALLTGGLAFAKLRGLFARTHRGGRR